MKSGCKPAARPGSRRKRALTDRFGAKRAADFRAILRAVVASDFAADLRN